MQFTVEKSDVCFHTIKVECDASEVKSVYDKEFNRYAKNARVNGFRKGHVPAKIIASNYGAEIEENTVNNLIEKGVRSFIEDNKLYISKAIEVTSVSDFEKDAGISFEVSLSHEAKIKLPDISDVEVKLVNIDIVDSDVDQIVEKLRSAHATKEKDENPDAVFSADNVAVIDFCGKKDGVEFNGGKAEDFELEANARMIPGFVDGILGHKAGDEFDINCKFPEDYHVEELKGKDAVFSIKVKSILKRVLPEVTDEFVKEHFNVDTVAEFRTELKNNITRESAAYVRARNSNALVDAIASKIPDFEIPEGIIERVAYEELRSYFANIAKQMNISPVAILKNVKPLPFEELSEEQVDKARVSYKHQMTYIAILSDDTLGFEKDAEGEIVVPQQYIDDLIELSACAFEKSEEFREVAKDTSSDVYQQLKYDAKQNYLVDFFKDKVKVETETLKFSDISGQ